MNLARMAAEAEVIVVGGGSAGCAMAARLAEAGVATLLLEAGKSDVTLRSYVPALTFAVVNNPAFDRSIAAEPDTSLGGRRYLWPAARRLGGGSAINGMIYVRGHRRDYDGWAERGATRWGFDDVVPYFRRMERAEAGGDAWRGDSGPITVARNRMSYPVVDAFIAAAGAVGIPRNPEQNGRLSGEGAFHSEATQHGGLRCSAARGYLRGAIDTSRLRVVTGIDVLKVIITAGRATGVLVRHEGVEQVLPARLGVVLSAGTLNTPRLLMLSGIGPAADLARHGIACHADSPEVGANLQEHVGAHVVLATRSRSINSDTRGWRALGEGLSFLLRRRGALTTSMCHANAFARTSAEADIPDVQISLTAMAFTFGPNGRAVLLKRPAVSVTVCLARPEGRGRVELRSADPDAPPLVQHRLLGSDADLERLARGIEIARDIAAQPPLADLVEAELAPGRAVSGPALRAHLRDNAIPLYHPVGTCRMGSDAAAVVDPDLAVRGVAGLWVADCSVMPTLPVGNTNATAMMIGDKGADHVLKAIRQAGMARAS
ncbi:GMC family oxidoreductase [Novosphingobium rhizosphaerae]|uniref:GMC family oxidoreductase n=1 Tax=Novosphingobium rhizosphaerae TaxID=1551649 RepID=UPI0017D2AD49